MGAQDEAGAVTLVDRILTRGVKEGASDVHIEPRLGEARVRFRVDGVLVERPAFAVGFSASVTSRLKVMAAIDIAEKRLPQDGTFRVEILGKAVDVRISTFPTEYGEKVVLRLLMRDKQALTLDGLGVPPALSERLRTMAKRAHGLLLVTGPTGSGKTSTLYALLHEIDARARNITTLEDPIEYRFADVIQGQANPKIGFTFARGLRAMLRQDPDVILVGEMRDAETSDIAFKAALTGHLVLSSLHTSSAIESFVRLFDMGLERYVVASALDGMLAQRLVRKLCVHCRRPRDYDAALWSLVGSDPEVQFFEAVGCEKCNDTGYRGRTGIFELIEVDDALNDMVKSENTTRAALHAFLQERGYLGLRRAGYALVRDGTTTPEEVLRVT